MAWSTTSLPSGRVVVHPITGAPFRFDGGAACVDFAFSGGIGEHAVFETIHTPDDLRAWLAAEPLQLDVGPLGEADLERARLVRHAVFTVVRARAAGEAELPADAVAVLNGAAAHPPLVPVLAADGRVERAGPVTLDQVLSSFARELVDLVAGPLADRIRECAADNCALTFVDASRPGTRRWCSMERCGNRHKVRAHRARRS